MMLVDFMAAIGVDRDETPCAYRGETTEFGLFTRAFGAMLRNRRVVGDFNNQQSVELKSTCKGWRRKVVSATTKHRGSPGDGRIPVAGEGDLPVRSTNAGFVLVERHLNFPKSQNARLVFLAPQRRGRSVLSETALGRFTRSFSPSKKRSRVDADYSIDAESR
jgi:hypothetical protein